MEADTPGQVGPYQVEQVLGEGGMGVVYAGVAPDGARVAVKVLRPGLVSPTGSALRRFEQEALIRIDHPNVVRVLGAGTAYGQPYIAFERLEGESLADRFERAKVTMSEAVSIVTQAARGLASAHERGIVHRDIKPSNLFLCADGVVKVVDFGVARVLSRETRLTSEGNAVGTAAYFSPEQARGEPTIDGRTDVWSIGVVLYEALAGRNPFERATTLATMLAVLAERPAPLAVVAPHVPAQLAAVVMRCLERRPDDRYPSARELVAALEAVGPLADVAPVDGTARTAAVELPSAPSIPPGEVRLVTLLLASDVRDQEIVRKAVHRRGGVYLPLGGDRAAAVFGGELWEGDEVERATRAAIECRKSVGFVAVASGRATYSGATGIAGAALLLAEAGVAARLAGVAVSKDAAEDLSGTSYSLTPAGDELFELVAPLVTPPPTIAPSAPLGPTVGRLAEIAQIRAAMQTAFEEGRAVSVLVTGPTGVGKTHLRREMVRMLEEEAPEPPLALLARGEPLSVDARFGLFRAMLFAYAHDRATHLGWPRMDGRASLAERQRALAVLVRDALGDGERAEEHAAFLGELLGIDVAGDPRLTAARRDPRLMSDRLRLAVLDWFTALSERGPLALVVEDLQWADELSLGLLEELLDAAMDAPFLVFATARPELEERVPGFLSGAGALRLELSGLLRSDVGRLAEAVAGCRLPAPLVELLARSTGGNPLFVEQTVLVLREEGRLDATLTELPMPRTIEAAVQGRLDHLPAEEKNLVKRAAVIGRPFTAGEVELLDVFGSGPLLASLVRRQILATRGRGAGAREYAFQSQAVQEVAYRMIEAGLLRDLHLSFAEALASDATAPPEEVGYHFAHAGRDAQAAAAYARATFAAAEHGDARLVVSCGRRALELGPPPAEIFGLHMACSDALDALGRLEEQEPHLTAALALAEELGDASLRARVLTDLAVFLQRSGRAEEALATASLGEEAARTGSDPEALAFALGRRAFVLLYAGRLDEAEEPLAEAERIAEHAAPRALPFAAAWRAQLASARGDHGGRREAYERAVRLHEAFGDLRRAAGAELNLADVFNRVGAYGEAEAALRQVVDKCRRIGSRVWEGYALLNLGYALERLGRPREALDALAGAAELAEETGEVRLGSFVGLYRARAIGPSDPDLAARQADAVVAETDDAQGLQVLALSVASDMHLLAGRPAEALARSTRAMALLEEIGGVEEDEAEVFLVHSRALRSAGDAAEASRVVERGRARVLATADRIRDRVWRDRFLRDVPAHRDLLREA